MEFSTFRTETAQDWETWYRRNLEVTESGVTVAREEPPTWVSPTPLFGTDAEDPPIDGSPVDVAVDRCGNRYLLTDAGTVYRQDAGAGDVQNLGCLWRPDGDPRAIVVTRDTIYVAWGGPGEGTDGPARVQSYARELGSTRRFREVEDPVDFVRVGDEVCLLDRGSRPGNGVVTNLRLESPDQPLVSGLYDPSDLAADDEGTLYVLDRQVPDELGAGVRYQVSVFAVDSLSSPPATAADEVRISPHSFRVRETAASFLPSAIAVSGGGDLVAGMSPDVEAQRTLMRYRPRDAAFQRQAAFRRGCVRLSAPHGAGELIAIDGEGEVTALEPVHATVVDDDVGRTGHLVTRFDVGEVGTQWHRVTLEAAVAGPGTQVRLHYRATDGDRPAGPDPDAAPACDLTAIEGIGPTYARRLRTAGIETVRAFVARDARAISAILGVEELEVPTERTASWVSDAEEKLASADGAPPGVQAVDGIGPTFAARLRDAGVEDLADLVALDAGTIADLAAGELLDVSPDRVESWQQDAATLLTEPRDLHEQDWTTVTPANPTEVLLEEAVGRYLWVDVELVASEYDAPVVRAVEAEAPRQSYLRELPAIYREDPESARFLEEFLALFESVFTEVEAELDAVRSYMDPQGIPDGPEHLQWLASWLAVDTDEDWPEAARRAFIEQAPALYRSRGTRAGLFAAIELYLEYVSVDRPDWDRARAREAARLEELVAEGVLSEDAAAELLAAYDDMATAAEEPLVRIIEHADLDCLGEGRARIPFENLLSCERGFLVLVHPWLEDEHLEAIRRIVAGQEPAHAAGRTAGLQSRLVLAGAGEDDQRAYHTYLGINTALSARSFELADAGLGRETVLAEREPYGQLDVRGRLGEDTQLS